MIWLISWWNQLLLFAFFPAWVGPTIWVLASWVHTHSWSTPLITMFRGGNGEVSISCLASLQTSRLPCVSVKRAVGEGAEFTGGVAPSMAIQTTPNEHLDSLESLWKWWRWVGLLKLMDDGGKFLSTCYFLRLMWLHIRVMEEVLQNVHQFWLVVWLLRILGMDNMRGILLASHETHYHKPEPLTLTIPSCITTYPNLTLI